MDLRIIVIELDMLLKLAVFELLKEMLKIVSGFFLLLNTKDERTVQ